MLRLAPTQRMVVGAALLSLLLLLTLLPLVSAQSPVPERPQSSVVFMSVTCDRTFLRPMFTQYEIATCTVHDLSRDAVIVPGAAGTGPSPHTVAITAVPTNATPGNGGWFVQLPDPFFSLYGGGSRAFRVIVTATPTLSVADFAFTVYVNYTGPGGYNETVAIPMGAKVAPYQQAYQSIVNPVQRAGQDDVVTYQLEITNRGVYPDSYTFSAVAPPDFVVSIPPNAYLLPGETRVVEFGVLTPDGKLYEMGRSVAITLKSSSVSGAGIYSSTASLQVRGAWIPVYWIPLVLVGLVSAAVVTRGARERAAMARLEAGRPRRVEPTPREAVLLSELRQRNRDAYAEKMAAMRAVYQERAGDYRGHVKERRAADREEAKRAKAEYVAARKERKLARKQQKREEKAAKIEAKKTAKIERRELKIKQKQLAKKRKELEKARKKADKIAAREAKVQAKADAKQAKLDAKQAKADAAAAKKAEKEAKKAAKAAQKRGDGS